MQTLDFRRDILPLKDKLFRLALRITFDRAEAEDIVQETMIRVWSKRDEWPAFSSIEAYCLTIARNLAIDRSERMDARTVELTAEAEQAPDTSGPHERLVDKLRDVEEKSYKEIAEVMGITEDQVKVTLFRARQKVKQQFMNIENYGL